jgi:hypothetical protein
MVVGEEEGCFRRKREGGREGVWGVVHADVERDE